MNVKQKPAEINECSPGRGGLCDVFRKMMPLSVRNLTLPDLLYFIKNTYQKQTKILRIFGGIPHGD